MPITVAPIAAAVDRLRSKTIAPTHMRTAQLAQLPAAMRERAFFSAGIESAKILSNLKRGIDEALSLDPTKSFTDRSKFVADMREQFGAVADGTRGALTDITGIRRLQLIYDFQVEDAHNYVRWKTDNDPEILDEYPCQELLRIESREKERLDWPARWEAAGGTLYDGRMIARKDDPVWTKISRFGHPWPPFDFGSGMGVEDVHRTDAEALGVIEKNEKIEPSEFSPQASAEASVASLSEDGLNFLKNIFGDDLDIEDGIARLSKTNAPAYSTANSRGGYHEWSEDEHPRDADGKFSATGAVVMGNKSIDMALRRKADVRGAMMHDKLGRIDFVWGRSGHSAKNPSTGKSHTDGYGISHILAKHGLKALRALPEVIAKGHVRPHRYGDPDKVEIHNGTHTAVLGRKNPKSHYAITSFSEA